MKISIANEKEMQAYAEALAKKSHAWRLITLSGELGAGKTTFARYFLRALGAKGKIKSPTYTIVEPYGLSSRPVYHFDFYRLDQPDELAYFGLDDYNDPNVLWLVEWPERAAGWLPEVDIALHIEFPKVIRDPDAREITVQTKTGESK